MAEISKTLPKGPVKPIEPKGFRYPSEEETYVRRFGSAVLALWPSLPPEIQQKLLAEATSAWDREYNVPGLGPKLEAFAKRHR